MQTQDSSHVTVTMHKEVFSPMSGVPDDVHRRRELFMSLARANESVVARVALRLCWPDKDMSDDIVQDALISALQAFVAGRMTDIDGFRPWLLKILMNAFRKRYNKEKPYLLSEDVEPSMEPDHESPEKILMDRVLDEDLQMALKVLNEDQRATVTLVDIEGLDYAEAASVLGVPLGTVRSRLARARLQMCETVLRLRGTSQVNP